MQRLILLCVILACACQFSEAQLSIPNASPDTFRLQKVPYAFWYRGEKIRKPARLQPILLAKNDLQINRDWQQAKTTRSIGTGVMVLGLVLEAVGLSQLASGDEGGTGLVVGGAGVMLGGVLVGMLSKSPTKRAVMRYNDLEMGRASVMLPMTEGPIDQEDNELDITNDSAPSESKASKRYNPNAPGPRVAMHIGINSSKFWEIGGSEEFRSDEKSWWAKSIPIVFSYEMPSSIPGQSLNLELTIIGKGERDKSESTSGSGTTKSKTDLQLTFVQLGGLKKFAIGPQDRDFRFHAQGGLFVGYAVNARSQLRSRLKDDDTRRRTRQISKFDFGDGPGEVDFKRLDAGLIIGAGASYPFKYGRLLFDARFSVVALNLQNAESFDPDLKLPSLHARDLTFMVGYSVPLSLIQN